MNSKIFLQWAAEKVRQQKNFILEARRGGRPPASPGGPSPAAGGSPRATWGAAEERAARRREAALERREENRDQDDARRLYARIKGAAELQAQERLGVGEKEALPSTSLEPGSNLDFLRNLGIDAGYMASRQPVKSERHSRSSSAEALGMQEEYNKIVESEEKKRIFKRHTQQSKSSWYNKDR